MHPYSIDTKERRNIYFVLAIISIILSWILNRILLNCNVELPWWAESPSVLLFYSLTYTVFNKWGWKIFNKIGLIKTPNISGNWTGHLQTSFDEHSSEIEANLTIFQNWTKIKIILKTEESTSRSETASIITDVPEGKYLNYQYINEPKSYSANTMHIHRGTTRLLYDDNEESLIGEYFTGRDRQNFGSFNFSKDA